MRFPYGAAVRPAQPLGRRVFSVLPVHRYIHGRMAGLVGPSLFRIHTFQFNNRSVRWRCRCNKQYYLSMPVLFTSPLGSMLRVSRHASTVTSTNEEVSTPPTTFDALSFVSSSVPMFPTKYPLPPLTEEMKRELEVLERRFERLELEPYGPKRGIETTLKIMEEEKLEKRFTKGLANLHLNNWIYRRYSLHLGYPILIKVPGDIVANTLIREGTTVRFWKYKNPKTVLKELFRYGESVMQQRYWKKDVDSFKPKPPSLLTPEEEAYEKKAWDYSLYAPKPYGHKRKRLGKWRK